MAASSKLPGKAGMTKSKQDILKSKKRKQPMEDSGDQADDEAKTTKTSKHYSRTDRRRMDSTALAAQADFVRPTFRGPNLHPRSLKNLNFLVYLKLENKIISGEESIAIEEVPTIEKLRAKIKVVFADQLSKIKDSKGLGLSFKNVLVQAPTRSIGYETIEDQRKYLQWIDMEAKATGHPTDFKMQVRMADLRPEEGGAFSREVLDTDDDGLDECFNGSAGGIVPAGEEGIEWMHDADEINRRGVRAVCAEKNEKFVKQVAKNKTLKQEIDALKEQISQQECDVQKEVKFWKEKAMQLQADIEADRHQQKEDMLRFRSTIEEDCLKRELDFDLYRPDDSEITDRMNYLVLVLYKIDREAMDD